MEQVAVKVLKLQQEIQVLQKKYQRNLQCGASENVLAHQRGMLVQMILQMNVYQKQLEEFRKPASPMRVNHSDF